MSKKKFALAIILCFLIAFGCGYAIHNNYFRGPSRSKSSANIFLTIESPMGIYDIPITNLITNIGENQTATRQRVGATYVAVKYISLSNDASASATWTKLPNEATTNGAERTEGTVSALWLYGGDAAYNVTVTFHFTGDITLQCAGGNWSPTGDSDGNLYSCANFDQTNFANNWNMTIRWVYVFDGN